MSAEEWDLCFDQPVPAFAVSVPDKPETPFPKVPFVRLTPKGSYGSACFRVVSRNGGGHQLWVAAKSFRGLDVNHPPVPVQFSPVSGFRYHFYRIRNDPLLTWATIGSAVVVVSVLLTNIVPASPTVHYALAGFGIAGAIATLVGAVLQADTAPS
jgi:hypothetical protein